nr:MAG TPA: hypothetical protein [Caudoviricetes sp.]
MTCSGPISLSLILIKSILRYKSIYKRDKIK